MYYVYWVKGVKPFVKRFQDTELSQALNFSQKLRNAQEKKNLICAVSLCSELEINVTKMGVSAPPSDYFWPKRRLGC